LCPKGKGGAFVELAYSRIIENPQINPQDIFPINTHGGLLAFGAPWEVPAMYNIIEAFAQLQGQAGGRQIRDAKRALVYGNGGIFSHSAVAILGNGKY
jgi:acetyl-CoA acetyltransferase